MVASMLKTLAKLHFITPRGLFRLVRCFMREGITLMAIVRFAASYYKDDCALVFGRQRKTYLELYEFSRKVAIVLQDEYGTKQRSNVGVVCKNNIVSSAVLIALSRLGANIRLLNTDLSMQKLTEMLSQGEFDLVIYDEEMSNRCLPSVLPCKGVSTEQLSNYLNINTLTGEKILSNRLDAASEENGADGKLSKVWRGGSFSVLTGGSSGKFKEASRSSSIAQFLPPLYALLNNIRIQDNESVLIALPFYHGFGLSTFIVSLAMGKKICLMNHFDANEALATIIEERVEALPVVPAMLSRLLQIESASDGLQSVRSIICGGDRLDKNLVETAQKMANVQLYNLYGTSEAGFFLLATHEDLLRFDDATIGKPICGVNCEVRDVNNEGVGVLWVKTNWAMIGRKNIWQSTGDLVARNSEGFFFFKGRNDKMVVCGGENVYPENVEQVLNAHPSIVNSLVYAVADVQFGQVLHAQVEKANDSSLTEEEILQWVRPQLSRAEIPHKIVFGEIKMLSTGKKTAILE